MGMWLSTYAAKTVVIRNADVQGMRVGISSPFYQGTIQQAERGRGDGSVLIEDSLFRDYIGVVVAATYASSAEAGAAIKRAVVRNSIFEPLDVTQDPGNPPAAISMNYRMSRGDPEPRDPIVVQNFNRKSGENFNVYYSADAPGAVAPCKKTRPEIDGWVCP